MNASVDVEVPFVFGGDEGTVVVPGTLREAACDALVGLRTMSQGPSVGSTGHGRRPDVPEELLRRLGFVFDPILV